MRGTDQQQIHVFSYISPEQRVRSDFRGRVAIMGSNEDVRRIQDDEYRVNFKEIGPEIDNYFQLDSLMENSLNEAPLILHSFAHSGLSQIGRRFRGDELAPHYEDDMVLRLIPVMLQQRKRRRDYRGVLPNTLRVL